MRTVFLILLSTVILGCSLVIQHEQASEVHALADNSPRVNQQHVLLISIDGYRHDYTRLHQPGTLAGIASQSAKVTRLKPSYPTKTFPNHYTLVTGLYPHNHGIVSNKFYDPKKQRIYQLSDREAVTDGSFYQGVPIWSLAAQQDVRSATYFWPGSEAEIAGHRPDYWRTYQHHEPLNIRVEQVVDWFSLSDEQRPRFVSLYFHEVDTAGHSFGPNSPETKAAIDKVDLALATLFSQLEALTIDINIIITSDHGMTRVTEKERVMIDTVFEGIPKLRTNFTFIGEGPFMHAYVSGPNKQDKIKQFITESADTPGLEVYRRDEIPARLNYDTNESIGDLLLLSDSHYLTFSDAKPASVANHGFNADIIDDMNTLLYGYGPAFDADVTIDVAKNIHLYPLMAHILGLTISETIDGDISVLAPLLRQ